MDPATGNADFWDRAELAGGELILDAWDEQRDQNALSWLFSQEAEALGSGIWNFESQAEKFVGFFGS
jgi:hypothetical protein